MEIQSEGFPSSDQYPASSIQHPSYFPSFNTFG